MPLGLGKSDEPADVLDEALEAEAVPTEEASEGGEDSPVTDAPPSEGAREDGGRLNTPSFRPSFLDEAEASTPAAAHPAPQGDVFFVTMTREDGTEIHRFDDPAEAQTFVEQLLTEGMAEGEVTAFSGHKLSVAVSHRPVVKLLTNQED